ncbi:DiGeorge syndrome critical region protein 14 [Halocaridina rubra]|uniref:DiGeorge syndrome critical region protein 14 n=1 Tax=Halocaridina rubra TaxID=373956 RepID=A0AAN8WNN8_HALRR
MGDSILPQASPGQLALEVADHTSDIFKKPCQPAPRKRKKVLDEDTYVKEVEKIIERDYFPDLEDLKEKVEYLEAKEANDIDKLREFYSKYSSGKNAPLLRNVEDSPATFETPLAKPGYTTPLLTKSKEVESNLSTNEKGKGRSNDASSQLTSGMSLDEFLDTHTSEDNESFEQIMEENERRFRLKHAWMFNAEEKHNEEHLPNLALPTIAQQEEAKKLAITGTSIASDSRPKQVENWKFNTFNSVMFVPDGVPLTQSKCIEMAKQNKRVISLSNTRYESNPFTETLSQAAMLEASAVQASKKEGKVGVDGKELGKETPKINGYSFVTAPSPVPGVDASPLMTWGEVEGTPFLLEGSQTPLLKKHTPGPSYRIPKEPNRDRLGHMLAEQVSLRHRSKKLKAVSYAKSNLSTPQIKFGHPSSSERVTAMSPAAQRLLSTKLGIRHGTDKALRQSYTPSPSVRGVAGSPGVITPRLTSGMVASGANTPKHRANKNLNNSTLPAVDKEAADGLTDNLLYLPKRTKSTPNCQQSNESRKCAADFF